eukprot:2548256-Pyramimonas_sp.AAC.1
MIPKEVCAGRTSLLLASPLGSALSTDAGVSRLVSAHAVDVHLYARPCAVLLSNLVSLRERAGGSMSHPNTPPY